MCYCGACRRKNGGKRWKAFWGDKVGVVWERIKVRESVVGDAVEASGSSDGSVGGGGGVGGSEEAKPPRDEEDPHLVGPHMVRNGQRHRLRHLRPHRLWGQEPGRTRRRFILRHLRRLCHACRLLLHRICHRNSRRWYLSFFCYFFIYTCFSNPTKVYKWTMITFQNTIWGTTLKFVLFIKTCMFLRKTKYAKSPNQCNLFLKFSKYCIFYFISRYG